MIHIITIFFIVFNDIKFSLLVLLAVLSVVGAAFWGLAFTFCSAVLKPNFDLGLGEIQGFRQFFSLLPHHVLVLLESLLKFQELTGGEGGPDSLWFAEG